MIERDKAAIGVFICIEKPTEPMITEAADAGFSTSPQDTRHLRLQILTIEDLLAGKKVDMPAWRELRTFKKVQKAKGKGHMQNEMF